jgi:hypothetical protein
MMILDYFTFIQIKLASAMITRITFVWLEVSAVRWNIVLVTHTNYTLRHRVMLPQSRHES